MPITSTEKSRSNLIVASVVTAVLIVCIAVGVFLHQRSPLTTIGGPFTLTASTGQIVTDRSWPDKYLLVYFGYTSCPDVCPTTMADLAIAMKKLGPQAAKIQPLFITVDPARDTPAVLKEFVAQFTPTLIGLTGSAAQIAAVEKSYRVYAQIHPDGDHYQVDHSSIFYLMDPDGKFITVIPAEQEGDALAANIAQFLNQEN